MSFIWGGCSARSIRGDGSVIDADEEREALEEGRRRYQALEQQMGRDGKIRL